MIIESLNELIHNTKNVEEETYAATFVLHPQRQFKQAHVDDTHVVLVYIGTLVVVLRDGRAGSGRGEVRQEQSALLRQEP